MDELTEERRAQLRETQTQLLRQLDALAKLDEREEWQTLKELVFNKSVASIERQQLLEAQAKEISLPKLYKLQGEWEWAKRYSDVDRFADSLKKQLKEIKSLLK